MALARALASAYLAVSRWTLTTEPLPDKVIVIGAPHTSNWDGVFMAVSMWKSGRSFSFLVKDSVVKAPVLAGSSRRSARFPWSAAPRTAWWTRWPTHSRVRLLHAVHHAEGDAFAARLLEVGLLSHRDGG